MKKLLVMLILASILVLPGCETESGDSGGITEPTGDSLTAISNSDATVVEDATVAQSLLDQTLDEVVAYLNDQRSASISDAAITASETETSSYDDTFDGPVGGTVTSRGSFTNSYTSNEPSDSESVTLPFTLRMSASVSGVDTTTFTGFRWTNASSVVYQLDGTADSSASFGINLSAVVTEAGDAGPTVFDGSVTGTLQGQLAYGFTIQPASGAGNAARVVLYINGGDSFSFDFDQNTEGGFEDGPPIGEMYDPSNWDISGSIKVFDDAGTMVDSLELTTAEAIDYIGLFELVS
jgi:hypothetical protein